MRTEDLHPETLQAVIEILSEEANNMRNKGGVFSIHGIQSNGLYAVMDILQKKLNDIRQERIPLTLSKRSIITINELRKMFRSTEIDLNTIEKAVKQDGADITLLLSHNFIRQIYSLYKDGMMAIEYSNLLSIEAAIYKILSTINS